MKRIALILIAAVTLIACNKNNTDPTPVDPIDSTANGCPDGFICFTMDGKDISKQAGGYQLADTQLFVKYEEGTAQLSLDIFGTTTGAYNVTDVRKVGNARIYYFSDGSNGDMYMAETGNFEVTAYDASTRKVSGKFSGTLHDYDNSNSSFIKSKSVTITNGEFKNVRVPK